MNASIEIRGLTRRFGELLAVDDVSFEVHAGEVLGFLGPNGAGKSTTMKMVTGFLAPTAGSVRLCGVDVASDPRGAKRLVGYLPEGAPAYPDMTPASLLRFVAEVRGLRGAEGDRGVARAVELADLKGVLHQRIETLSKGFKRRVGLAAAILHDPPVLVLDEPTDGLDPNQKHEVRRLIRSMAAEKAILLSTHILEEVEAVCTRAIIIASGKVLFDGTPEALEARSPLFNAVAVTLAAESAEEARGRFSALPEVEAVERLPDADGWARLRVRPRAGRVVAGDVARLAREANWRMAELRVERVRLDDVFRELTTSGGRAR